MTARLCLEALVPKVPSPHDVAGVTRHCDLVASPRDLNCDLAVWPDRRRATDQYLVTTSKLPFAIAVPRKHRIERPNFGSVPKPLAGANVEELWRRPSRWVPQPADDALRESPPHS